MLKIDSCGCLYLVHGDVVFLVSRCEDDGGNRYAFAEGLRPKDDRAIENLRPVPADAALRVFAAWGDLIADGYDARKLARVLARLQKRAEPA